MSPIGPALRLLADEIAGLTGQLGRRVDVMAMNVTDRAGLLELGDPGLVSPNGACRLIQAADGWIAVNLAREEDRDLIPAWLGGEFGEETWPQIERLAPGYPCAELRDRAALLGLPVAVAGETTGARLEASLARRGAPGGARGPRPLKVVDMSALWAGPLCGAVLAAMGAQVTKVESVRRPDPTRTATPAFFARLNGEKADLALDFANAADVAHLREEIACADVLITSGRPRAFAGLGLEPDAVFAANPGLVWTAISGYGWTGEAANRVAFGDDAAAAGWLLRWTANGEPRFLGDALADPVTGLAAAVGALRGLLEGGGVIVEAALARCAAGAAGICGLERAA